VKRRAEPAAGGIAHRVNAIAAGVEHRLRQAV
jgi:hypothetical protein